MKYLKYLGVRAVFFLPQIVGIVLIAFIFVRLIPGDPARLMAGPLVPESGVEKIREQMGLTGSLPSQFFHYVGNVLHGDFGKSWYTGNTVREDIASRLPATLELIVTSLALTLLVVVPLALKSVAVGKSLMKGMARRSMFGYGMLAGAFPDFWLGLLVIFVFYVQLQWAPAPVGQLDIAISPPTTITGAYVIDSLLTANWEALRSALAHMVLPVFVLTFVYSGAVAKIAIVTASRIKHSEYVDYAKVSGLPPSLIQKYVRKSVYPSVATMSAFTFGFLIGGAVLVESVFSWGGFGQYAVQAVVNSDFEAIQGVVLVSALLTLLVYMFVDFIYFWVDPRIQSLG
jgi:ABC-type dipeptide/oligopeptide/nickel transport systems, permease components